MANNEPQIYHEKQRLQFCLLHALNNLFQNGSAFTRESLNDIATQLADVNLSIEPWSPLSWVVKPHHNVLTGNYDANVLDSALRLKGLTVVWHDVRHAVTAIDFDDDRLMGFVLNTMVRKFRGMWKSRHWIALRKIGGVWYNLDSDLNSPQRFENNEEVTAFLGNAIDGGAEVLLVRNDNHPVYHETQRKGYCLLHTLNNLFQERNAFTRASLNHIAKRLVLDDPERQWWTPLTLLWNPHYDICKGNYDVNVLDAALRSKEKTMEWHDSRRSTPINLEEDGLMGIVLNVQLQRNTRHWFAVRKIGQFWYNLDSSRFCPHRFQNTDKVRQFVHQLIGNGGHILLVRNS